MLECLLMEIKYIFTKALRKLSQDSVVVEMANINQMVNATIAHQHAKLATSQQPNAQAAHQQACTRSIHVCHVK